MITLTNNAVTVHALLRIAQKQSSYYYYNYYCDLNTVIWWLDGLDHAQGIVCQNCLVVCCLPKSTSSWVVPETLILKIRWKLLFWNIWILLPVPVVRTEISQRTLVSSATNCKLIIRSEKAIVIPTELKIPLIYFFLSQGLIYLFELKSRYSS